MGVRLGEPEGPRRLHRILLFLGQEIQALTCGPVFAEDPRDFEGMSDSLPRGLGSA